MHWALRVDTEHKKTLLLMNKSTFLLEAVTCQLADVLGKYFVVKRLVQDEFYYSYHMDVTGLSWYQTLDTTHRIGMFVGISQLQDKNVKLD